MDCNNGCNGGDPLAVYQTLATTGTSSGLGCGLWASGFVEHSTESERCLQLEMKGQEYKKVKPEQNTKY